MCRWISHCGVTTVYCLEYTAARTRAVLTHFRVDTVGAQQQPHLLLLFYVTAELGELSHDVRRPRWGIVMMIAMV